MDVDIREAIEAVLSSDEDLISEVLTILIETISETYSDFDNSFLESILEQSMTRRLSSRQISSIANIIVVYEEQLSLALIMDRLQSAVPEFVKAKTQEECPICLETKDLVFYSTHQLHPGCEDCLKGNFSFNHKCHLCRASLL